MRIAPFSLPLLALAWAAPAHAHLSLVDPPSRSGGEVLKDGPCGEVGSVRGTRVTTFEAGQTIDIVIDEYIDHPSHYRVAFDVDGDDDFPDPVCVENCDANGATAPVFAPGDPSIVLADFVADESARMQTITVTLPDVVCERCTIQVIQVMYDKRPYTIGGNDNYYQCADVVLVPRPGSDAGVVPSDDGGTAEPVDAGSPSRDAGTPTRDAGTPTRDAGTGSSETVSGGCSCRAADASGSFAGFALAIFALRRRRVLEV
ncbi:MAG: lytic polysaccharide monooxygenase [Myxococcales bacterium]|nr:lytic polysaccharide monooxygenase [Myxococcales bacterium]